MTLIVAQALHRQGSADQAKICGEAAGMDDARVETVCMAFMKNY